MNYADIITEGDRQRQAYKDGIDAYIQHLNREGYRRREEFMPAEGFEEKIEAYRACYIKMLGIDKIDTSNCPEPSLELCGEDADCRIYRVVVSITPEIPMHGLLMIPHGTEKAPLVIAQHGGGGTPELCSDMHGKNNYNHMVRRLLARGAVVFAPQLLLWNYKEALETNPQYPIPHDRRGADNDLKRYGMSITGLEIRGIMNCITYLSGLSCVDESNIGMVGISYGGYYTLHTMAADPRIKVGFSNACFNDRNCYPWPDWSYPNSGNTFHDAEVAGLCAPRKLVLAVGKTDLVFDYRSAPEEAERARKYYASCGCPENLVFDLWDGGHTLNSTDDGFDFLFSAFG